MNQRIVWNFTLLGIINFLIYIVCYNIFYGSFIFIDINSTTKQSNDPLNIVANENEDQNYVPGFVFRNKGICPNLGVGIKLLIIVISAPLNFEKRMVIRRTWGESRSHVKVAFLMGTTHHPFANRFLRNESDHFDDIIIGHFKDNHRNLTLKSMSMIKWTAYYCSKALFLLKVEDDMYINLPRLLEFVGNHTEDNNIIYGQLVRFRKPDRWNGSLYFVPEEKYPQEHYPDYILGPSYLFSASLASVMYQESLKQPFMTMEDVFITGLVAESLKINRVEAPGFINDQQMQYNLGSCSILKVISIPMHKFYKKFQECQQIWYEEKYGT